MTQVKIASCEQFIFPYISITIIMFIIVIIIITTTTTLFTIIIIIIIIRSTIYYYHYRAANPLNRPVNSIKTKCQ